MARSPDELHEILAAIPGVKKVYFQPPTAMEYPCIKFERSDSFVSRADNILYWLKKRYTVTVIDRDPKSTIPDRVESLPYSRIDRKFAFEGLNHTVFQLYF